MRRLYKIGTVSSFYLALAYLTGIIIFLFVLDYPSITEPAQKMLLVVNNPTLIYLTNLLMYVLFGPFLLALSLSLFKLFKDISPLLIPMGTALGIIWSGLLMASGMVANAGIAPLVEIFNTDPDKAALFWVGIETVANGLGGANGEILGGLMTLLISIAGLYNRFIAKGINILGILVGVVGILSVIPLLKDLTGVFGITQLIWFICLGIYFIRNKEE